MGQLSSTLRGPLMQLPTALPSQPSIHRTFCGHSPVSSGHSGLPSIPLTPAILVVLRLLW